MAWRESNQLIASKSLKRRVERGRKELQIENANWKNLREGTKKTKGIREKAFHASQDEVGGLDSRR
jgi:hypothetical protein